MQESLNVLIIGSVWPEPASSAAGSRMVQLMQLFDLQGWKVTFASAAANSEYSWDLEAAGIQKANIELNSESFDTFVETLKPSLVLFDRFMTEEQYGWRVAEQCPGAMRILDTEDLHCLRAARQQALKEERVFDKTVLLDSDLAKREIASIYRCDLSLIISTVEMELLSTLFKVPGNLLYYLPFMLDPKDEASKSSWPAFEERAHFISIGNFLHAPNLDAVKYLKEAIWPLIRKELPNAELHVYGAYPSQQVLEWNDPTNGFIVKGRAENAVEVVRKARVCLAPLRFGAGIKGKLAEAMQCGTPSVTTDIGSEGMYDGTNWSGGIANTATGIAAVAIKLYSDQKAWQAAQERGGEILHTFFSKEGPGKKLVEKLLSLKPELDMHRKQNFTGAMLMHQNLAATKYMARWIEEKNKKK